MLRFSCSLSFGPRIVSSCSSFLPFLVSRSFADNEGGGDRDGKKGFQRKSKKGAAHAETQRAIDEAKSVKAQLEALRPRLIPVVRSPEELARDKTIVLRYAELNRQRVFARKQKEIALIQAKADALKNLPPDLRRPALVWCDSIRPYERSPPTETPPKKDYSVTKSYRRT